MGLVRRWTVSVLEIARDDRSHTPAAPTRLHALDPRRVRGVTQCARNICALSSRTLIRTCRCSRTRTIVWRVTTRLLSPDGEDVSIGATWRSTMMANSARDPYWQAGVRRETIDHPKRSADIQNECSACHMPMAQKIAHAAGSKGEVFAHLPVAGPERSALQRLASDGISCTVCHQIAPDRLGTRESFNANFSPPPTPAPTAHAPFSDRIRSIAAGSRSCDRSRDSCSPRRLTSSNRSSARRATR